jgi:hypothetical protein
MAKTQEPKAPTPAPKGKAVGYYFKRPGATKGFVTGIPRRFRAGDLIEAPEGEFAHVRQGWYETRPLVAKKVKAEKTEEETEE